MHVLRTRNVRVGFGVLFVAVLLASGCGSSSKDASSSTASTTPQDVVIAPDGPPQTGGTLTYGLASESDGWDPTQGRWATDGTQVGMAIFDPLAAYNADGDWAPYLAQSFTPNADFTAPCASNVHPACSITRRSEVRKGTGSARCQRYAVILDPRPVPSATGTPA